MNITDLERASFLCRLRSIAAHRDHFVQLLSVRLRVCLSDSHTFLVVTYSCFAGDTCIPRNAATMFRTMHTIYEVGSSQFTHCSVKTTG